MKTLLAREALRLSSCRLWNYGGRGGQRADERLAPPLPAGADREHRSAGPGQNRRSIHMKAETRALLLLVLSARARGVASVCGAERLRGLTSDARAQQQLQEQGHGETAGARLSHSPHPTPTHTSDKDGNESKKGFTAAEPRARASPMSACTVEKWRHSSERHARRLSYLCRHVAIRVRGEEPHTRATRLTGHRRAVERGRGL